MATRKRISVYLDPDLLDGLKQLKATTLVNEATSIRQSVREYLERKGVAAVKADRKRAVTRKRS